MTLALSHRAWFENDPAYADVPRELRVAGDSGACIIRTVQPAGHFARTGAPEISLSVFHRAHGRARATFGGDVIEGNLVGGRYGVAPANAPLCFENEGEIEASIVLIPTTLIRRVTEDCGLDGSRIHFGKLAPADREDLLVEELVARLWADASSPDRFVTLFADEAIRLLVLSLVHASGEMLTRPPRGGLAGWQLKRATDAMEASLDSEIGLGTLAAIVGCSATHFSRAFRHSTGVPPFVWLLNRRIERAKSLLANPKRPLAEIALAVGFSAQPQFTTAFKRVTGTTPGAWRRERAT